MIFLVLLLGVIAAGITYQLFGSYYDAQRFRAPGRLIDIGHCRLHLNEQGTGIPVVVLESGLAASSLSWTLVQPKIAEFTKVCSYDRAGLAWSDKCHTPRTLHQVVSDFSSLLLGADLRGPYVLVGHSFGTAVIGAYAHLNPRDVAGLVFVDPMSLDYWANCTAEERRRLQLGVKLSRRGALLARLGVARAALAALESGGRRFPKLIARASAAHAVELMGRLAGEVQKLPREVWPIVRSHWSCPKCFHALVAYLGALPESARDALLMPIASHIPLIILSASNATDYELEEREALVRQSQFGRHLRVEGSGHWVQLERPEAVIAAVKEMVDVVRGR